MTETHINCLGANLPQVKKRQVYFHIARQPGMAFVFLIDFLSALCNIS